jgi:integrase
MRRLAKKPGSPSRWRQITEFSAPEDWVFASPYKLGRQPLSYTFVWESLRDAAQQANIGHVSSHVFRHTYRSWLDSIGTPVGVQQKLMRHADIRTTMNIYRDAATADMRNAHERAICPAILTRTITCLFRHDLWLDTGTEFQAYR